MKLKLPENIEDITLDQYQKYTVLVGREDLDEISFNKRLISIFTDLKFRDIEKVAYKDYEFIVAQITLALTQEAEFKSTFKINGVEFGFIPNLNDISTGEYVDLSTHGTTIENMHKVMAVLFRPIKSKDFFGNYEIEPYTGTKQYAELMKYTPLSIVNGALVFFLQFIEGIKDSYPEIYDSSTSEGQRASSYFEKWGWYATIADLADNDILRIDAVLEKSVHEMHIFLAHRLDKHKLEAMLRKKGNVTEL